MAPEIDFLMWLFEQTRKPAVRLDGLINSFIASQSTVDDYEDLLVHIYGFEAPRLSKSSPTATSHSTRFERVRVTHSITRSIGSATIGCERCNDA